MWRSLVRKLNLSLISHLHLTTKVQNVQVREDHTLCQMGMKSGEFGLSETLQNKMSGLLNYNNKIGEIDENKRKGKKAK